MILGVPILKHLRVKSDWPDLKEFFCCYNFLIMIMMFPHDAQGRESMKLKGENQ